MTEHKHPLSFAARMRAARKARGITQTALAEAVGLCNTQLSSFERGVREPSLGNLRKIARALGVSADYLLGLTPSLKHGDPVAPDTTPVPVDRSARRAVIAHLVRRRSKDA